MTLRENLTTRQLAILGAAIAWGTMGFAKSYLPASASAPASGAVRLLGGAMVLGLLCRPGRDVKAVVVDPRIRWWTLSGGAAMAISQALYFSAMTAAGVAVGAIATLGTVPVFGGLIVAVSRRRPPARGWLLATALALVGVVALALGGRSGQHACLGVAEGVGAGLAYTIFTEACARQVRRGAPAAAAMALTLGLGGLLLSPVLMLTSMTWLTTTSGIMISAYLAVVGTAGTYLAYGWGLRRTQLDTVATLLLAEPATATVLGILVLHEKQTRWTWPGLVLIATALIILTRMRSEPVVATTAPGSRATRIVTPMDQPPARPCREPSYDHAPAPGRAPAPGPDLDAGNPGSFSPGPPQAGRRAGAIGTDHG